MTLGRADCQGDLFDEESLPENSISRFSPARSSTAHDVAPGPVGEGVEQGVRPVLVGLDHAINIQPFSCTLSKVYGGIAARNSPK